MAITNGYCTLAEFKAYAIPKAGADAGDDAVLEDLIEAASRFIDGQTGRTFYARTETREFDIPEGRELRLDDDLISVTTLTNGDGDTISSDDYVLLPANLAVKRAIKLKAGSAEIWELDSDGNAEQVISVAGSWGRYSSAPDDIKQATLAIARAANNRRAGQNTEGKARITAAGMVVEPIDVPEYAWRVIRRYARRT